MKKKIKLLILIDNMTTKLLENLDSGIKLRLILARLRNVCYYRAIDNRIRAQYIHVVRSLRKDIKEVLVSLPESIKPRWEPHFIELLRMIPVKAKTEDCSQVINNISHYIENRMGIDWSGQ